MAAVRYTTIQVSKLLLYPQVYISFRHNLFYEAWADRPSVYIDTPYYKIRHTMAVCNVPGLTLLLRVGTLWRCGDGLFFEVTLLASDAFPTTLHPLLENVLQTVDHFEISCLGAPFSWLEKHGARSDLYGGCSDGVPPIHFFQAEHRIQFRSRPHAISGLFQL
jgi:hypothetical protein